MNHCAYQTDSHNELYELVINATSGVTIRRNKLDIQVILDSYAFLQNDLCDFEELVINAPMDPEITRRYD